MLHTWNLDFVKMKSSRVLKGATSMSLFSRLILRTSDKNCLISGDEENESLFLIEQFYIFLCRYVVKCFSITIHLFDKIRIFLQKRHNFWKVGFVKLLKYLKIVWKLITFIEFVTSLEAVIVFFQQFDYATHNDATSI